MERHQLVTDTARQAPIPPKTIPLPGGAVGTLWFVNPWITNTIFTTAFPGGGQGNSTTVYIYVNMTNPKTRAVTITTGSLLISVSSSTSNSKVFFIGGQLYGEVFNDVFYAAGTSSPPTIGSQAFLSDFPNERVEHSSWKSWPSRSCIHWDSLNWQRFSIERHK